MIASQSQSSGLYFQQWGGTILWMAGRNNALISLIALDN
jgi:hypothetical protein